MGKINIIKFLAEILMYLFIFFVPILIYLKKVDKVNILKYLKIKENYKDGIKVGCIVSLIYISVLLIKNFINGFNVNFNIGLLWISALIVGFIEEIPFRGFLLQKLNDKVEFIKANIITSLIFVLFHFPKWLLTGGNIIINFIQIGIVSFVFGYLDKEYDSLWPSIICHSVFNLCFFIKL